VIKKKTIVISLGGSLVFPGDNIDISYLKKLRQLILSLVRKKYRMIIVVGGGRINSKYNKAAKKVTKIKPVDLDWLGIKAANTNSELIRAILADYAYTRVVLNPHTRLKTRKSIIVGSAWQPGCSTDLRAVQFALNIKADRVINLTDVDYVYNQDPNRYKNAKPLKQISWPKYKKMFGTKWTPRLSAPFDPIATKLACSRGVEVVILNGRKFGNITKYLNKQSFKGTLIK